MATTNPEPETNGTANKEEAKRAQAKLKKLLDDLQSGQEPRVLGAIKELRVHGTEAAVEPIIDVLLTTKHASVEVAASKILFEIKTQQAVPHLFAALKDDKSNGKRHILVSVLWEAGLDATEHLEDLVDLAISGDYLTCLECLTVIENFAPGMDGDVVFPLIERVQEAEKDAGDKAGFYPALLQVLQELVIG